MQMITVCIKIESILTESWKSDLIKGWRIIMQKPGSMSDGAVLFQISIYVLLLLLIGVLMGMLMC